MRLTTPNPQCTPHASEISLRLDSKFSLPLKTHDDLHFQNTIPITELQQIYFFTREFALLKNSLYICTLKLQIKPVWILSIVLNSSWRRTISPFLNSPTRAESRALLFHRYLTGAIRKFRMNWSPKYIQLTPIFPFYGWCLAKEVWRRPEISHSQSLKIHLFRK